jgi:hypothetical protein
VNRALTWLSTIGYWLFLAAAPLTAATWTENFSTNPLTHGWQIFGDTNLFRWDSTNQNLAVTWDSSRSNSFFARSFDTILAKPDDFTFAFDLQLTDLAVGVATNKPNAMPVAVGLVNLVNATNPAVWRGGGVNATHGARNVCEFAHFAAAGAIVDSFSPVFICTNNSYFYDANGLNQRLDPGAQFRVTMNFTAATHTLTTSVTRNGVAYGGVPDIILPTTATRDFRLDHFAINNWTDTGTADSLLAHGFVDNITVTTPPPAVQNFSVTKTNNSWQAQFISRTNFIYTLERTADFAAWTSASPSASGSGTNLFLTDTNAPSAKTFYRVRAERP